MSFTNVFDLYTRAERPSMTWQNLPLVGGNFQYRTRDSQIEGNFYGPNHNVGAVEFKMHKSNYRSFMRGLEQVTGLSMLYDQEGPSPREGQTTPANRKRK